MEEDVLLEDMSYRGYIFKEMSYSPSIKHIPNKTCPPVKYISCKTYSQVRLSCKTYPHETCPPVKYISCKTCPQVR